MPSRTTGLFWGEMVACSEWGERNKKSLRVKEIQECPEVCVFS